MKKIFTRILPILILLAFAVSWFLGNKHRELIEAIRAGDLQEAQQLSAYMPDFLLNAYHKPPGMGTKSLYGDTALHVAIKHSRTKIIEDLIKKGVDLEALTADYKNPLQLAAEHGLTEGVNLLLTHGAEVDNCGNTSGAKTPLFFAAENLHPEVIERLLAAGANDHLRDYAGETPLEVAKKASFCTTRTVMKKDSGTAGVMRNLTPG